MDPVPSISDAARRGHVRRRYRLHTRDRTTLVDQHLDVVVEGIGLGYLGAPARRASATLPEFLPEIYGVGDGLLFRAWLPEKYREADLLEDGSEGLAERIALRGQAQPHLGAPRDVLIAPAGDAMPCGR